LSTILATLVVLALAAGAALVVWQYYVTAPWTRDGRVRRPRVVRLTATILSSDHHDQQRQDADVDSGFRQRRVREGGFERAFANPPLAEAGIYVCILALLIVMV
jgi:hypothetical protein